MRSIALVAALALAACTTTQPEPTVRQRPPGALPVDLNRVLPPAPVVKTAQLENAPDGTRVTVKKGEEIKVLLDANPANDVQWRQPKDFEPVLSQIGQRIYINKDDARLIGAGGWNVYRFRAEQAGKTALVFQFGHLDLASPPSKAVRYEVTVE